MITGLKPRGFTWVIADRLAVSERIGGFGFQHRRGFKVAIGLQYRGQRAIAGVKDIHLAVLIR